MDELEDRSSPPLPFPLQHTVTQTFAGPAAQQGKTALMTLWAGQSASLCRYTDATELMTELIAGTDAYFSAARQQRKEEGKNDTGNGTLNETGELTFQLERDKGIVDELYPAVSRCPH
jgi:hypothetical protein